MGGGDKCLLPLAGQTLLQRTIDRAQPQVEQLLLSANGNPLRFARSGLTVLQDEQSNFPGPLAGVQAGLRWLHDHRPECQWLACFASDTPFFPQDLVPHLLAAARRHDAKLAVASSDGRLHPVFSLWHCTLLEPVSQAVAEPTSPRLQEWVRTQNWVEVDFPPVRYDAFFNINHPQDLYQAETLIPMLQTDSDA